MAMKYNQDEILDSFFPVDPMLSQPTVDPQLQYGYGAPQFGLAPGTVPMQPVAPLSFQQLQMDSLRKRQADEAQRAVNQAAQRRALAVPLTTAGLLQAGQIAAAAYRPQEYKEFVAEAEGLEQSLERGDRMTDPAVDALFTQASSASKRIAEQLGQGLAQNVAAQGGSTSAADIARREKNVLQQAAETQRDIGLERAATELQARADAQERVEQTKAMEIERKNQLANRFITGVASLAPVAAIAMEGKAVGVPDIQGLLDAGYSRDEAVKIASTAVANNRKQNYMLNNYLYAGQFGRSQVS